MPEKSVVELFRTNIVKLDLTGCELSVDEVTSFAEFYEKTLYEKAPVLRDLDITRVSYEKPKGNHIEASLTEALCGNTTLKVLKGIWGWPGMAKVLRMNQVLEELETSGPLEIQEEIIEGMRWNSTLKKLGVTLNCRVVEAFGRAIVHNRSLRELIVREQSKIAFEMLGAMLWGKNGTIARLSFFSHFDGCIDNEKFNERNRKMHTNAAAAVHAFLICWMKRECALDKVHGQRRCEDDFE